MRLFVLAVLMLTTQFVFAVSPNEKVEQLSAPLAFLWGAIRPVCSMSLDANAQQAVQSRLSFLDEKLIAHELVDHVARLPSNVLHKAWSSPAWLNLERLESAALKTAERENLREYYFKLQTQTPNAQRGKRVAAIQSMSQQLNISLRKELWKTCHALGLSKMPVEQMENATEQRWLQQAPKVKKQIQAMKKKLDFLMVHIMQNLFLQILIIK